MAFESLAEFMDMGGHGFYVWSAFLISISLLTALLWKPLRAQQQLFNDIRQQMWREKHRPAREGD